MISSHRDGPSWATAHLAQMTTQMEKESSPSPVSTAATPAPPPLPDPDTPLNLTKPKSSFSGATASSSPGSDTQSNGAGSSGHQEQPLAATAPKLFPPGLPMPRNYLPSLPYAGLPPHLGSLSSPSKCIMFIFVVHNFWLPPGWEVMSGLLVFPMPEFKSIPELWRALSQQSPLGCAIRRGLWLIFILLIVIVSNWPSSSPNIQTL